MIHVKCKPYFSEMSQKLSFVALDYVYSYTRHGGGGGGGGGLLDLQLSS